jgi:hypothetical protein
MDGSKSSRSSPTFETLAAVCLLAAIAAVAVFWCYRQGYLLYYGDALSHLNIARRMVDSRTPGFDQIGTVWLPLPHLLMLPFVGNDGLWRSGLAGAIPSSACFVIAGGFLFATVRRLFRSAAAAFAALLLFAFNPNALYLGSIPMTEMVFCAGFFALAYFTVLFRQTQSAWAVAAAGIATLATTLTRYEGWFLIPFATVLFLLTARRRRFRIAFLFGVLASAGPLYWLAHNWWFYGDALEFYHGPWSAKAIYQRSLDSGMQPYPGDGEWWKALRYYGAAARLCAGLPLMLLGGAGAVVAAARRTFLPLAFLLLLPPVFYVWSIHSSGTPVFVPHLWPDSYYNTRYGLMALPLLVVAASGLVAAAPGWLRPATALAVVGLSMAPWIRSPAPESWICWKESQVNSEHRRAWTAEAAGFFRDHYRGGGIITSFGDLTGVFPEAGLPLRETLHSGNAPHWQASIARPDLFLREEWALTFSGDPVATAILRARRDGPSYDCVKMIALRGAPVIEIYKRN